MALSMHVHLGTMVNFEHIYAFEERENMELRGYIRLVFCYVAESIFQEYFITLYEKGRPFRGNEEITHRAQYFKVFRACGRGLHKNAAIDWKLLPVLSIPKRRNQQERKRVDSDDEEWSVPPPVWLPGELIR